MASIAERIWDRASGSYDKYGRGPEKRWAAAKREVFGAMGPGRILFVAVGTGLDIQFFPTGRNITAMDISERMIAKAVPRAAAYDGQIRLLRSDVQQPSLKPGGFDQVFTSCTFCSVPDPVEGLRALRSLLRPGGELRMFEHTGSGWFPFNVMLNLMTPLSRRFGPSMNRNTTRNVAAAGFEILSVRNVYLDVLKVIVARA
ncbi:MAG: methyltransferase domain-containing protein [Acidobacteria bacterium]|nr:methyltransferase domain-containing protein [Acidobacteriota bacterium]